MTPRPRLTPAERRHIHAERERLLALTADLLARCKAVRPQPAREPGPAAQPGRRP